MTRGRLYADEREVGVKGTGDQPAKATILVVEDQPPVLKVVERALEMSGFQVLAASSPEEALRMLRERGGHVDLLLTDVVMPEMSGPELASRVRLEAPTLRVLFMSGYAGIPPSDALDQIGEFSVLEKPFRPKELVAKVRSIIEAS